MADAESAGINTVKLEGGLLDSEKQAPDSSTKVLLDLPATLNKPAFKQHWTRISDMSTDKTEDGPVPPNILYQGRILMHPHGKKYWNPDKSSKFIGIRYLFPAGPKRLYDKIRVWVERHKHKYFVDWTADDLEAVDTELWPLQPITTPMYKKHMNRSEFCRIAKLKYCMDSKEDWAVAFRTTLSRNPNEGGFRGLCQAKCAASDLWRKHSRSYHLHQARFQFSNNPNSQTKTIAEDVSTYISQALDGIPEIGQNDKAGDCQAQDPKVLVSPKVLYTTSPMKKTTPRHKSQIMLSVKAHEHDTYATLNHGNEKQPLGISPSADISDRSHIPFTNQEWKQTVTGDSQQQQRATNSVPGNGSVANIQPTTGDLYFNDEGALIPFPNQDWKRPATGESKEGTAETDTENASRGNIQLATGDLLLDFQNHTHSESLNVSNVKAALSPPATSGHPTTTKQPQSVMESYSPHRSEDMDVHMDWACDDPSNLFPRLSDTNLTLLEKTIILVHRHKHNYFLNWTKEQLAGIETLVRPYDVISRVLYRRYCNQNVKNHDASLRFVMEEMTEPWALRFQNKLISSPCDDGFQGMHEVRFEALSIWNQQFLSCLTRKNVQPGPRLKQRRHYQRIKASVNDAVLDEETYGQVGLTVEQTLQNMKRFSKPESLEDALATKQPRVTYDNVARNGDNFTMKTSSDSIAGHPGRSSPMAGSTETPTHVASLDNAKNDNQTEKRNQLLKALESANALFQPLPESMAILKQVDIWMERHANGYFLQASKASLIKHSPHIRPMTPVTTALYMKCMDLCLVSALQQLTLTMASSCQPALAFKQLLADEQYRSIEYVLVDAMTLWNNYVSKEYTDLPKEVESITDNTQVDHGVTTSCETTQCDASTSSKMPFSEDSQSPSFMDTGIGCNGFACDSNPSLAPTSLGYRCDCHYMYDDDATYHTRQYAEPYVLNGGVAGDSVTSGDEPLDLRRDVIDLTMCPNKKPSQNVQGGDQLWDSIWGLRASIQEQFRESMMQDPTKKLLEYKTLLDQKLGSSYQIPVNQTACLVDLILCHAYEEIVKR